jgi:hypothetical protein
MHKCTAAVLKALGKARIFGLGPVYFFMASAKASSKLLLVFMPITLA